MPAPSTGRDLHVDQPLSNVLLNRRPEGFIADQLMPLTQVSKQSDMYYRFNHKEWYRHEGRLTDRAPGTEARKVHMTVASDTYFARNYALGTDWPVEDEVNADEVLRWAESSALFLNDRLMTDWEFRVADIAVNTSNVGTVSTVASAWQDRTNSQPYTDILNFLDNFRRRTGVRANTLIIPEQVFTRMTDNNQLRDLLFGDRGGVPTTDDITRLFSRYGIRRTLSPHSLVNTEAERTDPVSSDAAFADIWGPHFWLAHINPIEGRDTDTWMNAFRWTNPLFGVPMAVIRHPFDTKKRNFEIEASYYQDEKVVSPDLCERVTNVVSL